MSAYLNAALLNAYFRNATLTRPTAFYVSLHTSDPGDEGLNEVSGGAYARQPLLTGASTQWTAAAPEGGGGYRVGNGVVVTFPTATASWGTVTHFALWDAVTGGWCWFDDALGTSRAIGIGDAATFDSDDLGITLRT